jgi:hypothetical protein
MSNNTFEKEGLMTDEEAREIIFRLGVSASGALLGFSLFVNHIMNTSATESREDAHEHIEALAADLHANIDKLLEGKLSEKDGVYKLNKRHQQ